MAYLALILLSFLSAVNAVVVANYPVNAQLPPVARVSQPFKFVFSQGTFGGSDSKTVYSLSNAPSWLKMDSTSRTLSGTPEKKDAGSPKFDLIASDPAGSATMQVTLIVTADEGPSAGKPLAPQLQAMGPTSSPSNIVVHSGDSFSISFDPETFINTHPSTIYYGTSYPENAPLPSWIGFDQSSLRFYGTAPSIGSQTFSLNLVASDVSGFSATTMTFKLTVSPHILSFKQSAQTLFINNGEELASPHFIDTLTLDGVKPASDTLTETEIDAPDWLEVDKESLSFKGNPPADGKNSNVTITVKDSYQDVATLVVSLHYSQFFREGFDDEYDAVIGQFFSFTFNSSALTNDSAELDVDFDEQLSWLHYSRDNKTLYGEVPSDIHPDTYLIQLTAREGTAEGNKTFSIKTVDGEDAGGDGASPGGSSGSRTSKAGIIVMAIFIPLGCIAIILFLLYCRRRRQQATGDTDLEGSDEKNIPPAPVGPELSHCQPFEKTTQGNLPAMVSNPPPESQPPKLELEPWWNVNSDARDNDDTQAAPGQGNTFSSSAIDWDFTPLRDPEQDENKPPGGPTPKPTRLSFQSSPPVRRCASNRSQRREPLKPIQPRRSLKRNSAISSRSRRWSKRSSGISSVSTGLPVRLSGAGHGAGGFGPPGHGFVKLSWQNTQASLQSEESNVGNLAPLFPRPPVRNNQDHVKRMSMRTVDRDSLTISESDSLDAFVQGRARSRHSSNPFIAGGTGRRVSSSLRALERGRSNASRSDTVDSSLDNDESRRRERPWSQAMSGSVYTDDYRHSAYLSSLSEESPNVKPLGTLTNGPSQSSLAQHYSKIVSPLPRFFSELSLNNTRCDDSGGAYAQDSLHSPPDTRRWSRSNPSLQNWRRHRKSPSASSIPYDAKPRRVSLIRAEEQDSSYQRGLREPTGSLLSSDIAFV